MKPYTDEFFDRHLEGSRRSALLVVPMIMDLVRPKRVVDVGCGRGTWLAVFRDYGAEEILGIDGDYVDQERLEIAQHEFLACDLSRPLALDRQPRTGRSVFRSRPFTGWNEPRQRTMARLLGGAI
jgi:trans-aconitate methyltransferase